MWNSRFGGYGGYGFARPYLAAGWGYPYYGGYAFGYGGLGYGFGGYCGYGYGCGYPYY